MNGWEFAEEDQLVGVPAEFFLKFTDGGLLEWLARFDGPAGHYQHLAVKGDGTLEGRQHVAAMIKADDQHEVQRIVTMSGSNVKLLLTAQ